MSTRHPGAPSEKITRKRLAPVLVFGVVLVAGLILLLSHPWQSPAPLTAGPLQQLSPISGDPSPVESRYSNYAVVEDGAPANAPQPPRADTTQYCDDSALHRRTVDRTRQALTFNQAILVRSEVTDARAALVAQLRANVGAGVTEYYSGPLADNQRSAFDEAIDSLDPASFTAIGGGVSSFICRSISDNTDGTTRVQASATMWAIFSEVQGDGTTATAGPGIPGQSEPGNLMLIDATVDKSGKVTELTSSFANGGGP